MKWELLPGHSFALSRSKVIPLVAAFLGLLTCELIAGADDTGEGPNLIQGDFERGQETYNPWAGVDSSGALHVWSGSQLAVDGNGNIRQQDFSPSVAVADLNGDGLPDLVVADARGFFWFFPNSGKPSDPAFTHGEIMPVWLGNNCFDGDTVPRIQMIDYDGDGKLDIVAGTYSGQLYLLHNDGSVLAPRFRTPEELSDIEVPTHKGRQLWCNYLAPYLFDWTHNGRLDLLLGDGTYSANSIYLLDNQGQNGEPVFNEIKMSKLIPGMGREHLTPAVVDWNNDGKADIISGERDGFIDLYVNQAVHKGDPPLFDPNNPQHISFGGVTQVGAFTTVCAADLNNDKLFDLVVANSGGVIMYSLNQGTLGHPKFGPLVPFRGINRFPPITLPERWSIVRDEPYGLSNELLECTNSQREKDLVLPPGFSGKGALKFSEVKPGNKYFVEQYTPKHTENAYDDLKHNIVYNHVSIQTDIRYKVSMWVRSSGNVSNLTYRAEAWQTLPDGSIVEVTQTGSPFDVGETWQRTSANLEIDSRTGTLNIPQDIANFKLNWEGDGVVYFDDISLKRED